MSEPEYALRWPRAVFKWEAQRLVAAHAGTGQIQQLLREAFEDSGVATQVAYYNPLQAEAWLSRLIADDSRMLAYEAPTYYAERQGAVDADAKADQRWFGREFFTLLWSLQERGYFPTILPTECVDDPGAPTPEAVSRTIRAATKLDVTWPIDAEEADGLPETVLYTLVEYFHDQARRPREAWFHNFYECGWHYSEEDRLSGGAVYRWRVNELLAENGIMLRLAATGPERGRLIQSFGDPLDALLQDQLATRPSDPLDEIAHAVRDYRARGASVVQKRAALALLAGDLEKRRASIKPGTSSKDEGYLFDIANNFGIRHRNDAQRMDVSEAFLDWIFWNYLAMIRLLDAIERGS